MNSFLAVAVLLVLSIAVTPLQATVDHHKHHWDYYWREEAPATTNNCNINNVNVVTTINGAGSYRQQETVLVPHGDHMDRVPATNVAVNTNSNSNTITNTVVVQQPAPVPAPVEVVAPVMQKPQAAPVDTTVNANVNTNTNTVVVQQPAAVEPVPVQQPVQKTAAPIDSTVTAYGNTNTNVNTIVNNGVVVQQSNPTLQTIPYKVMPTLRPAAAYSTTSSSSSFYAASSSTSSSTVAATDYIMGRKLRMM